MTCDFFKASRGRPKTFDRDHVLNVAMHTYWQNGVDTVSVNEICKKAQVSKPGLYREFNNEEGLMIAALGCYEETVLKPMFEMLTLDKPFKETLNHLVDFVTLQDEACEPNSGCLMVKMRQSRMHLTRGAQEKIDDIQAWVLMTYQEWIERCKEKGEFKTNMSSTLAASYIDTQIHSALAQLAQGETNTNVKGVLALSFSVLV
ncbi:TetR/AcrR family transcriptional regulator [Oceanospirillaceae bacterium]|mgnify:FL=1|jgi:AcrR family transcriptional regulator|nr:TetR/AcrR family transcriptional regulator [Oceanospirillaceae bacterium]MDA9279796.1 TetR/AcrR family transcriptional regulator [bacterium]MBT4997150.1 TetR/AcrR family transcriptional regulator [Oceanospirillaceae bacterium]MBT6101820.1 TetR/AcrR family transcriptional regulator [Oceanospirillaceae bacterium]MDB4536089.1 TetR/AcrR family transcriptional regulator [Oceanospirillaceae bacterium]